MASDWVSAGERSWKQEDPTWGIWAIPESQLKLLPRDMTNMTAIELGCGTAYVSAWMARRGAEVVGIDNSSDQLQTAERLMTEHGVALSLIHGNAETAPYPDASFDFAISEYGAAIWCDPEIWIPEAHRLLKPGGMLTFLGTHPLAMVATPVNGANCDERLHRPYFGMHKLDWRNAEIDPGGIEFNLTQSNWLRLFRETGFEVINYMELQAPANAAEIKFTIPGKWAQNWPSEQVWQLRATTPAGTS
ncbi:MAG: methyltransferase domain-containing protein [Gammaproteobacteria bacterium]|nr:methyltransferase domain-containing protein [Gammaproteobacteria bacterium]